MKNGKDDEDVDDEDDEGQPTGECGQNNDVDDDDDEYATSIDCRRGVMMAEPPAAMVRSAAMRDI